MPTLELYRITLFVKSHYIIMKLSEPDSKTSYLAFIMLLMLSKAKKLYAMHFDLLIQNQMSD